MSANVFQSYVLAFFDNYTDVYEVYSKGLDFSVGSQLEEKMSRDLEERLTHEK